ncbi:MAG: hypothetical protein UX89_C0004G0010 [Parcubacteria group bacterium GW2011_GWA2_47_16]|nr:MAG: hypothetical protein UX89_C0004G0010 [Parcubacteria group bacterium GW2011_GWA2_47_16]
MDLDKTTRSAKRNGWFSLEHHLIPKSSRNFGSLNPTTIVPSMSMTGTPICPDLVIASLRAAGSAAAFLSVNVTLFAAKKSLAMWQK